MAVRNLLSSKGWSTVALAVALLMTCDAPRASSDTVGEASAVYGAHQRDGSLDRANSTFRRSWANSRETAVSSITNKPSATE